MELILALVWAVEKLMIGPVWWLANTLASIFYPFEGSNENHTLSMAFFLILVVLIIVGCVTML